MNLPITGSILDLIVVAIIILMAFRGYTSGLVLRVYSLCLTLIALFIANIIAKPISEAITIIELDGFLSVIGQYMNNMLILLVVFFLVRMVLKVANVIIKPIIKTLTMKIILIKQVNQLGGILIGLLEGFVYTFVALMLILTPLFSNGQEIVSNTIVSSKIVAIGPDVSNTMLHAGTLIQDPTNISPDAYISYLNIISFLHDNGMINESIVKTTIDSLVERTGVLNCNTSEYNKIVSILEDFNIYSSSEINKLVVEVNE